MSYNMVWHLVNYEGPYKAQLLCCGWIITVMMITSGRKKKNHSSEYFMEI